MNKEHAEAEKLRNQGQSLEAAKAHQKNAESSKDVNEQATSWHAAGISYSQAGKSTEATECFAKAKEKFESELDKQRVVRDEGISAIRSGDYSAAKDYLEDNEQALKALDNITELSVTQSKLAVTLSKLGDQEAAQSKLAEAIDSAKKGSNPFYLSTVYGDASKIYHQAGQHSYSIDCLSGALGILELEDDPHAKKKANILLALAQCYEKIGNDVLSKRSKAKAEPYLAQLDQATRDTLEALLS